jgi:hypothetical protein
MKVIELPDDQAAALTAKAQAQGLTLEGWFEKLAAEKPAATGGVRAAADIILSSMRDIPPEIMATMPKDGASEHDHYIYGWPKKEA